MTVDGWFGESESAPSLVRDLATRRVFISYRVLRQWRESRGTPDRGEGSVRPDQLAADEPVIGESTVLGGYKPFGGGLDA